MSEVYYWIIVGLYFLINIMGTIYFVKLKSLKKVQQPSKYIALVTVFLGWMGFFPLNLISIVMYQMESLEK